MTCLRQYRTIRGTRLARILFRHISQKSQSIHKVSTSIFVSSDEKSYIAIRIPELCGIALIQCGMRMANLMRNAECGIDCR